MSEVLKIARADLTNKHVPRAIAIRNEGNEAAISRNCGVLFGANEISQSGEIGAHNRVSPRLWRMTCQPKRTGERDGDESRRSHARQQQEAQPSCDGFATRRV